MKAWLEAGNAEAPFIEGVKQYFALDQPKNGLKHLRFSTKNNQGQTHLVTSGDNMKKSWHVWPSSIGVQTCYQSTDVGENWNVACEMS
ncbi:unnamed protein product [Eruca vesicaria subsp. sativa]|uniref:Uncharacterized protein n=1 Tax=Eruca vesicaria subsp. sativa TaxID=29727 RepID=A0ABC8JSD1_ERUVS|nr:unnamed protein product [Eruca vesicaria subsp. sativa]